MKKLLAIYNRLFLLSFLKLKIQWGLGKHINVSLNVSLNNFVTNIYHYLGIFHLNVYREACDIEMGVLCGKLKYGTGGYGT